MPRVALTQTLKIVKNCNEASNLTTLLRSFIVIFNRKLQTILEINEIVNTLTILRVRVSYHPVMRCFSRNEPRMAVVLSGHAAPMKLTRWALNLGPVERKSRRNHLIKII